MPQARCLCGDVTWDFDGPYEWMSHCHCARCRKTHGSAFATYAAGAADQLRLHGREHIVNWESTPGFFRAFCRHCGSVVPGEPYGGLAFAPAGNFIDDPGSRPIAHIFVASKAPWFEIRDGLPRFDAYPPGIDAPVLADRPPLDPPGGTRGSCLCGEVSYVIESAPLRAMNCHCARCRRARSAAHASNLFTSADGVRFTRGENQLSSYKVPDAQRFTQVFCTTCGSNMPRLDHSRNIAVIPMGGLDDDPGMRPQAHIFVGSKAPWYDIADDLPQHQEYPT
jgi:hypothetical protein